MKSVKKVTAVLLALVSVFSISSCGKKNSDIYSETANATEAVSEVTNYTEKTELTVDDAEEFDVSEKSTESTKVSVTSVKETKTTGTEKTQKSNPTTKAEEPKTKKTEKIQEKITAAENDFKNLEEILNKDGGYILRNNFNYKKASRDDFINVAQSYGFVPAYRVYVDKNAFSDKNMIDIDNDGYYNMTVPVKSFNWILKYIYNYSGEEFSQTNDGGKYIFKGDNVYFWLPPDEGGVYGEFRKASHSEKDGIYTVKLDFYGFDPYLDSYPYDYKYYDTYVVEATLKEVDNVDGTQKIKVWSIYSIEKEE